ncbi:MAG: hypothetical protein Q9220_000023 [cf. Caloplaca sp. 1 TL-2023]
MININGNVRACSVPLPNRKKEERLLSPSDASTNNSSVWVKKLQPGRIGYFPKDNSVDEQESQDKKRSIDELAEFARTVPPSQATSHESITGPSSKPGPIHDDSGRQRRLLEPIQLKRLFRIHRSMTTGDLNPARMEVALKKSSSGRKYKKITGDPKLYGNGNPSTYQINLETSKRKGEPRRWTSRKSQVRSDEAVDTGDVSGQISSLLTDSDDFCRKVMDDYARFIPRREMREPVKAAVTNQNQASNGYSPSKGLPRPEPAGLQDFAAATTLAIAQAHAHSKSPERLAAQFREHASPTRKRGKHAAHRKVLSKASHSVPINFQMRPQRNSLPKTPRTSLEPSVPVETASPSQNASVKPSPTKSSGGSVGDDGQSDAESGVIMNARSAEFIHDQGVFGVHIPSLRRLPKPGPAPTRALPSLPEGLDSTTPVASQVETEPPLAFEMPAGCGSSPQQKSPKSPRKGHRYRLSPVKNNVSNVSSTQYVLRPSRILSEEFPRPPCSLGPEIPSEAIPVHRTRDLDVSAVVSHWGVEKANLEDAATVAPDSQNRPTTQSLCSPPRPSSDSTSGQPVTSAQNSNDADRDNLYMPWQQSRVERVKQLRARDMERQRSRQRNARGSEHAGRLDETGKEKEPATPLEQQQNPTPHPSSALGLRDSCLPSLGRAADANQTCLRINSETSPIIAEQPPPSTASHNSSPPPPNLDLTHTAADSEKQNHTVEPPPRTREDDPHSPPRDAPSPNLSTSDSTHHPSHASTSDHPSSSYPTTTTTSSSSTTAPAPRMTNLELRLEARIAAVEKKNMLLERAFLAVIDASAGFRSSQAEAVGVDQDGVEGMLMAMRRRGGEVG